uniref:Pellino FHA domain-containing protein n=1 Tax=Anopheles culicifacies TaxID=139723 RepID=A0A182MW51_9DIPT
MILANEVVNPHHHGPGFSAGVAHINLNSESAAYNGFLPQGDRGRRRSKFVLYKRVESNGVKRSKHYIVQSPQSSQAILDAKQHSISYTLSRNQAVIVEYKEDPDTDMFQVSCLFIGNLHQEILTTLLDYFVQQHYEMMLLLCISWSTKLLHLASSYALP